MLRPPASPTDHYEASYAAAGTRPTTPCSCSAATPASSLPSSVGGSSDASPLRCLLRPTTASCGAGGIGGGSIGEGGIVEGGGRGRGSSDDAGDAAAEGGTLAPKSGVQLSDKADWRQPPRAHAAMVAAEVHSLETYNSIVGSGVGGSCDDLTKLAAAEGIQLNLESCPICCSEIVLGPQQVCVNRVLITP